MTTKPRLCRSLETSSPSTILLTNSRMEYGYRDRKTGEISARTRIVSYYSIFKRVMKGVYRTVPRSIGTATFRVRFPIFKPCKLAWTIAFGPKTRTRTRRKGLPTGKTPSWAGNSSPDKSSRTRFYSVPRLRKLLRPDCSPYLTGWLRSTGGRTTGR